MEREFEQITLEFSNRAQHLFILSYENFRDSVSNLYRQKDENVFQQQLAKYLYSLKNQLESITRELMHKYRSSNDITHLYKILSDEINVYLNEFRQKANSL